VYVKSRISKKLQKMQIVRANHLHVEKENQQEIFPRHQEERGIKDIIRVGDVALLSFLQDENEH